MQSVTDFANGTNNQNSAINLTFTSDPIQLSSLQLSLFSLSTVAWLCGGYYWFIIYAILLNCFHSPLLYCWWHNQCHCHLHYGGSSWHAHSYSTSDTTFLFFPRNYVSSDTLVIVITFCGRIWSTSNDLLLLTLIPPLPPIPPIFDSCSHHCRWQIIVALRKGWQRILIFDF